MSHVPNAASNGALIQHSGTSPNQKAYLPSPFELKDPQILDRVYLTHVNDDEICDTKILFDLVSTVVLQSVSQIPATSFKPEFSTLKLISCQMITTRNADHCVHQTTMWILQNLRSYSWDAKAIITLAAFTLEYGNYLHLSRAAVADTLGSSLRQLNQVHTRKVPADITKLVTFIVHAFQHLKEWATWADEGYELEEVPSLTEALQHVPVAVYWTIAAIVASTGNLVGVSTYNLQGYIDRLDEHVTKLAEQLNRCKLEIGHVDDYFNRRNIFDKPKDIVDLLKALIHRNGDQGPQIFEGGAFVKQGLEVFKQKHVLLFISGLNSIVDEILLLNSIYNRLKNNPTEEIKGFKKEDFKILWVPMVDRWDEAGREQYLNTLKRGIEWYRVEYFFELPGRGIIKDPERLGYEGNPIIPVFNPQGKLTNDNAMDLIFQWGIEAFPFRKSDGDNLILKWKWLWDIIKKATPGLKVVKDDRYIFIFGSTNNKWIQDFTIELDKLKRNETVKRADVIIEQYQLGKDDPNRVPSFWMGVERKKQNKKHQEAVDCEIQGIVKSLFCLKRDPQGWVILSKGQNIKLLGHGEAVYKTVVEFPNWKEKVLEREGFDIAFKEYYDIKAKEISARQPCEIINVDNYSANVIATITCPNPMCGRVMEVTSVNYKCCHSDAPNGYGI